MRPQIITGLILGALLAFPTCRAQTAPDPLTQQDYQAIANAGVPLDSIRRMRAAGPTWPDFNAIEIAEISRNFSFSYCYNFDEQRDAFTWLMHYDITLSSSPQP